VKTWAGLTAGALAFALLATANSGGYRYGVSDQAFYTPAVLKALNPSLYPHDTPLIETQAKLMLSDKLVAALARLVGVDLPPLYFAIYALALLGLYGAAIVFARSQGFSWWVVGLFLVLLTLHHRIAKTGANSLEGYMHPREAAFALGVAALACLVASRYVWAIGWTLLAALMHPTTALWFAIVVAVAVAVGKPAWRRGLVAVGALAAVVAVWAALDGPLAGRFVQMDSTWLGVLADKDYLFPTGWPLYAWASNGAYPVVIALIYRRRRTAGVTSPGEPGLVAGLAALVAVFLASVPLTAMHVAIAVQLQVNRVFWLLDFAMAAYLAWWLASGVGRTGRRIRTASLLALVALSFARGYYVVRGAQPERRLIAVTLPNTPWVQAMMWLKAHPVRLHVLADPGHAWKYGVSVRLAAEDDTMLESGKDSALAMYDRTIAIRVADRTAALSEFDRLAVTDLRTLATRYALDVVIVEGSRRLELPELYRNTEFVIYALQ
jgi:hypothetical protein